jgi:hypothetical protein
MKQTAVEQFIEQLEKQGESWENMSIGRIQISIKVEDYINLINQAKEVEKQQQDEFAIEFTEWCNDNYFRMGNTNIWLESKDFEIPIKYTTKELLEIFKNK